MSSPPPLPGVRWWGRPGVRGGTRSGDGGVDLSSAARGGRPEVRGGTVGRPVVRDPDWVDLRSEAPAGVDLDDAPPSVCRRVSPPPSRSGGRPGLHLFYSVLLYFIVIYICSIYIFFFFLNVTRAFTGEHAFFGFVLFLKFFFIYLFIYSIPLWGGGGGL